MSTSVRKGGKLATCTSRVILPVKQALVNDDDSYVQLLRNLQDKLIPELERLGHFRCIQIGPMMGKDPCQFAVPYLIDFSVRSWSAELNDWVTGVFLDYIKNLDAA